MGLNVTADSMGRVKINSDSIFGSFHWQIFNWFITLREIIWYLYTLI